MRQTESGGLPQLQQRLGYRFSDARLLERALTHRSFSADHNERLEFLGDAVLDLVVAHMLFDASADSAEGDLSRMRANLVCEQSLHQLALRLGLPELIRLGAGEQHAGGAARASILADALEALIGAVHLDGGYAAASDLVRRLFEGAPVWNLRRAAAKDAKTSLQEWLQARHLGLPQYEVLRVSGAEHEQVFEVTCSVDGLARQAHGSGRSRRKAEQVAAAALLRQLVEPGA